MVKNNKYGSSLNEEIRYQAQTNEQMLSGDISPLNSVQYRVYFNNNLLLERVSANQINNKDNLTYINGIAYPSQNIKLELL